MTKFISTHNGHILSMNDIPCLPIHDFLEEIVKEVKNGARIACLSVNPMFDGTKMLFAVLAQKETSSLLIAFSEIKKDFPSITPNCTQVHLFEREIAEQWGVIPIGHPWLKPVRFEEPHFNSANASDKRHPTECGVMEYFHMDGEEINEVAVGPVHAGIIEPGHFRFQCHGETVYHLEISLGYQHRGVENALVTSPNKRRIHYAETLAGDTTIGHATAYCRAIESLSKISITPRAQIIRGIALELERVANHIGDLGALAGDIGFLPTQSYCGRIRGDVLNLTAAICGNRFGRGLVRPGGINFDITDKTINDFLERIKIIMRDSESAVNLLWNTPSVLARLEGTGTISSELCKNIGLVGVAARACGEHIDVRKDFPYGIYRFSHIPIATCPSGDVFARALVRWQEVERSLNFVQDQLEALPHGIVLNPIFELLPQSMIVTLVEGWRGEICHVAFTDNKNQLSGYKIVDPSFHNWFGLACAMRNQQISDFPLCNKSFNLSYCGYDL